MDTPFGPDEEAQDSRRWRDIIWHDLTTKHDKYDLGTLLHHTLVGIVIVLVLAFGTVAMGITVIVLILICRALRIG